MSDEIALCLLMGVLLLCLLIVGIKLAGLYSKEYKEDSDKKVSDMCLRLNTLEKRLNRPVIGEYLYEGGWYGIFLDDIKGRHKGETKIEKTPSSSFFRSTRWIPNEDIVYYNEPIEALKRKVEKRQAKEKGL